MARKEKKAFKWSDDQTVNLIISRADNDELFTGKRGSAAKGWKLVATHLNLPECDEVNVKKKWNNLMTKYKECKYPPTGAGIENQQITPNNWKFFEIMDDFLRSKDTLSLPDSYDSSTHFMTPSGWSSNLPLEVGNSDVDEGIDSNATAGGEPRGSGGESPPAEEPKPSTSGTAASKEAADERKGKRKRNEDITELLTYFKEQDARLEEQGNQILGVLKEFLSVYKKKNNQ